MIASKDRSGWFGGSDVDKIVGNWKTKTWCDWWMVKLGIARNNIETVSMNAGTHKEHQVLEFISPFMETDKQILLPDLCLRVNLDGNLGKKIYEVKTHAEEKEFKPSKKYIQQVNVQMFAFETRDAEITSYGLTEEDYNNYFLPIDENRVRHHPVQYDEKWVETVFLPKITILADCLKRGVFPDEVLG